MEAEKPGPGVKAGRCSCWDCKMGMVWVLFNFIDFGDFLGVSFFFFRMFSVAAPLAAGMWLYNGNALFLLLTHSLLRLAFSCSIAWSTLDTELEQNEGRMKKVGLEA